MRGGVLAAGTAIAIAAALAVLLGLSLAWQDDAPERALRVFPALAVAQLRVAESTPAPESAVAHARRALARRPLDGAPMRVLALEALRRGDAAAARDLFSRAARRAPRDRIARAWLAEDAVKRGQPGEALAHLDALMRMDAQLPAAFASRLAALSDDQGFATQLGARMGAAPWRDRLLVAWAERPADAGFGALLARLGMDPTTMPPEVRAAWAASLLRDGRWGEAYVVWDRRPRRQGVADGDFEDDRVDGFGWALARDGGVQVARVDADGAHGRALRVDAAGDPVPGRPAAQRMVLPAGTYVFATRARADGIDRGAWRWVVVCAGMTEPRLAATPALRGSTDWQSLAMTFTVPAGCAGQWLALEADADIDAGRQVRGVGWFDDVTVRRASGPGPIADPRARVEAAPLPAPAPDVRNLVARVRDDAMRDVPVGP